MQAGFGSARRFSAGVARDGCVARRLRCRPALVQPGASAPGWPATDASPGASDAGRLWFSPALQRRGGPRRMRRPAPQMQAGFGSARRFSAGVARDGCVARRLRCRPALVQPGASAPGWPATDASPGASDAGRLWFSPALQRRGGPRRMRRPAPQMQAGFGSARRFSAGVARDGCVARRLRCRPALVQPGASAPGWPATDASPGASDAGRLWFSPALQRRGGPRRMRRPAPQMQAGFGSARRFSAGAARDGCVARRLRCRPALVSARRFSAGVARDGCVARRLKARAEPHAARCLGVWTHCADHR